MTLTKWDRRFLELAQLVAGWSKDPSTQCGAVIVRQDRTVAGVGFNGFPRGIEDMRGRLLDREFKLAVVIHAEENALLHVREPVAGCTVYTHPLLPCPRCAAKLIQAGIVRVVAPKTQREECAGLPLNLTRELFCEAGVKLVEV